MTLYFDTARRAGLTRKQAEYLVGTGAVIPDNGTHPGTGNHRTISPTEVIVVNTIGRLRRAGFDFRVATLVARSYAETGDPTQTLGPGLTLLIDTALEGS